MSTPVQQAANRRNAQKSTGPKTRDGKHNAARNALKHGAYASRPVAIPRGHFAENPDEIADYLEEVIAALAPRDHLEYEHARRIAMYYLRLRRLGHLEAEDLAGHTSTRPNPLDQFLADAGGAPHPDERRERAAGQALERSLRTASMIDARTAQALDRALLLYGKLQERILADEPEAVDGPEAIDVEST